ncbi:MAG: hypothetical protein AAGB32_04095 [Pseudomonadota bacterium]
MSLSRPFALSIFSLREPSVGSTTSSHRTIFAVVGDDGTRIKHKNNVTYDVKGMGQFKGAVTVAHKEDADPQDVMAFSGLRNLKAIWTGPRSDITNAAYFDPTKSRFSRHR